MYKKCCVEKLSNPLCVTFQVFISAALMEYFCSKVSHTVWITCNSLLNVIKLKLKKVTD